MLKDISNSMILIIEDNQTQQNIMQVFLKNYGFHIMSAYNGDEAFRILESILPDLILLDVMLPGIDGFAICRQLKANPRTAEIPVIFITALRNENDIIKGLQAGASDYLGKPFNQEELIARVSTHLKLKISKDIILEKNSRLEEEILKQDRTKKALALSEEKFKTAFNSSPTLIIIARLADQIFLDINETFLQTTGYNREEVLGKTSNELKLLVDNNVRKKILEKFLKDDSVSNAEAKMCRKDGSIFPAIISMEKLVINDEDCYISVITDISERKRLEEIIQAASYRYKKISKLTSDFAFSLIKENEEWISEWTFGSLTKLCGFTRNDIDEYPNLDSFIADKFNVDTELMLQELQMNKTVERTELVNTKSGKDVWIRAFLEPEIKDGELLRIYGSLKDISRLREIEIKLRGSEERFKKITESANSLIGELEPDGTIIYANQGFQKLLGFNPDAIIGTSYFDLLSPDDMNIAKNKCQVLLNTKKPQDGIMQLKKADGTLRWFSCNANLVDINNEYKTIVFVCIDIHSRIESEQQLKTAYLNIEELNNTKDKFFSIIAHDLKGPISSFRYLIESFSESYKTLSDEEIENNIDTLHSNTVQLLSLLEDLLEWSRTQTGKIHFNPENFAIQYLINNVISLNNANAIKKEIKLNSNIEENLFAFADVQMISAVIRNLVNNAIKFTRVDGKITVTAESITVNSIKMIQVTVCDNGIGIEENRISKLFSIESNTSTVGTNDEKGTGLGLILCREFVERNGGTIRAESIVDKGSKFIFTVPEAVN